MKLSNAPVNQLFSVRNRFGKQYASEKIRLLKSISISTLGNKTSIRSCTAALLFLIAYPDNKTIYKLAQKLLDQLQAHIKKNEKIKTGLYNTGLTGSSVCAAFSFEMVKWLRKTRPDEIRLRSFEAGNDQIQSILSVVMPKVESEVLQDGNADWKGWFKPSKVRGEDLLDRIIAVFDSSNMRPEVKDELWNAIGLNVEIDFTSQCCLPQSITDPYTHRSLFGRQNIKKYTFQKPMRVKLTENEAEQIIDCSRMILVRHLREIDPISYTMAKLVSYYRLPRGYAVALMGMSPERRHPIDSYTGYMVFKNGLPVAYAGCWILFNSGRIGLNVFSDYRGGESSYIFEQVLQLHSNVFQLKRFTVDPYQIGKDNRDGIYSGAFWIYYHTGFRPLKKGQQLLAASEAHKIGSIKKYRSPVSVLKTLADSRQELVLQNSAVRFDATDLSRAYAGILNKKYKSDRRTAEKDSAKKLAKILHITNYQDDNMKFILKNWAVLLLSNEKALRGNNNIKKTLKKLFLLKANGNEEAYIFEMQNAGELRKFTEQLLKEFTGD